VALPGGYGTLEELCEVVTWAQLGLHEKPCGLLNVERYYDALLSLLDHAVAEQFLRPAHRALVIEEREPERLLERLTAYHPPVVEKWIRPDETWCGIRGSSRDNAAPSQGAQASGRLQWGPTFWSAPAGRKPGRHMPARVPTKWVDRRSLRWPGTTQARPASG
jgi:hypothetical protein